MKKMYFSAIALALFMPMILFAQRAELFNKARFFIGSGSKTALFVADFNNQNQNECLVWGYRFEGSPSAEQMIHAIDSMDDRLMVEMPGGFLSDLTFLEYVGLGGQPNWWASLSYDNDSLKWDMNNGISETLGDSSIFGISYTPWDANYNPIYVPENPVGVYAPTNIELESNIYSVGTGSEIAFLIADFNNGAAMESIIIGYRFDGVVSAEKMLHDIDSIDSRFTINAAGGFISDFSFLSNAGLAGQPNWWASFTYDADSLKWDMNNGISETLGDSSIFGISYTPWDANYNPIYVPENPVAIIDNTGISEWSNQHSKAFPNPFIDQMTISFNGESAICFVYTMEGKEAMQVKLLSGDNQLDLGNLKSGLYTLYIVSELGSEVLKIQKQ